MFHDHYYNLIAVILLIAILSLILVSVKVGVLLWKLTKGGSLIYPTKGYTPLGLLFGEKILLQAKISPYFQTSRAWGIPFFIAFRPFQDMTITEKCFIFTKAHWYYGWSNGSGHAATTEYHFFSREDYETIKPDDFRSYRNGQSYFYISKISIADSRLVIHSKADNMPELVKRIKIKDKEFLEEVAKVSDKIS